MQDRIRTIEKDLDLNNNFLVNCNCKQYDTIKFIFHMFMDGEVADLSDCIFRLQAKKGDGLPYINNNSDNISVIGNIVTIDNDNQLTARAGDTFAEVVITDKNGHMKTTFDIRLNIKSSAIDGLVDSEATITILDSLEEKLNKVDNIGTVLEEANTTEKSLNNLIPTGNILKDNLDSIIGTGSTLKNDLDTVVQSSSTLKDNLDIANILAESNIDELNKIGDVTDLAIQVQTNTNNISDLEADKTDILNAIGTTNMGTTATTVKGAIAEHENQINNNTTQLNDFASYGNYAITNNISIPTGIDTLMPLDLVIQSNDFFELVDGKIKILKKGTYLVSSAFSWEAKSSVGVRFIQVYVNDAYVRTNTANPVKDNGLSLQSLDLFNFNAGDILYFNASQNSGESINILVTNAHETRVKIKKVG